MLHGQLNALQKTSMRVRNPVVVLAFYRHLYTIHGCLLMTGLEGGLKSITLLKILVYEKVFTLFHFAGRGYL
jgi:hypothetical protein